MHTPLVISGVFFIIHPSKHFSIHKLLKNCKDGTLHNKTRINNI